MNWYQEKKSSESKPLIKTAAKISHEYGYISKDRWEKVVNFTAIRVHETSYYVQITTRQFDNSKHEPYWFTMISAFSFEGSNIVYKKCIYHKNKANAKADYKKVVKILEDLRQEQEANNIPTASLPSMIWYALHDIDGDKDLKPKAAGNIVYIRQDHNVNENKGNLFKNIIFLDKANTSILEKDSKNISGEQKGMF